MVRRGRTADPARLPSGRTRAHAEKAQVETVRRQLLVHVAHRVEVVRPGGPDLDRGAIGQQSVHAGLDVGGHVAPPFPRRLAMPNLPAFTGHRQRGHRDRAGTGGRGAQRGAPNGARRTVRRGGWGERGSCVTNSALPAERAPLGDHQRDHLGAKLIAKRRAARSRSRRCTRRRSWCRPGGRAAA